MHTISQRELRNNSATVMDAVEAGESYRVTRNGHEVAEIRPVTPKRRVNTDELAAELRKLPKVDHAQMRSEADEFFGADRVGDHDPWEHSRG